MGPGFRRDAGMMNLLLMNSTASRAYINCWVDMSSLQGKFTNRLLSLDVFRGFTIASMMIEQT